MRRFCFLWLLLAVLFGCTPADSTEQIVSTPQTEVYFSPKGGIEKRIIDEIRDSKSTIDMAIFDFTNDKIAQSLKDAKEQGVKIRIIMDSRRAKGKQGKHSEYPFFRDNGFAVKLGKGGGSMHHKFIIFDSKLLMTGSYNITDNAEQRNDENVLFIPDDLVIERYQVLFKQLWVK